ncbi:alanine racemase [Leifsonia xyli subsp. xyli]|uniref:Alanine racemase n=2 Tax=Leifsonia xyli subsp. xyli TaxID=59736 RepID=Q6AFE8_LEIXX|nr:alanine racemase C-terminal domain-containing protein [Leifsonia xyli]AAT88897.1 alanine racemase [Leifsonia xyli subsp. xyli str. CTCB07]ODA90381.1 alanine racemase [Leifsonia xyli subsp. xyli]
MTPAPGVRRHAHIDLDAIVANAISSGRPLTDSTADLRVDAYGHGLIPVARVLSSAGTGGFLVSRVEDAATLADDGVPGRILVGSTAVDAGALLGPELFGLDPRHPSRLALRLVGEIVAVKRVAARRGVSYGYTYRTERPSTLVLVALGYADGLLRVASNRGPVQVGTVRGRVSGRIAMDQFVVDIGDADTLPGDPVVVFGDPGRGEPTVLDWADALGVAAPVITSRLGRRIERRYA